MKKSVLILEMILVVLILSFLGVYFNLHMSNIYSINKNQKETTIKLIELESTRAFIHKQILNGESIDSFFVSGEKLFFGSYLLLSDVDYMIVNKIDQIYQIEISILSGKIIQKWQV